MTALKYILVFYVTYRVCEAFAIYMSLRWKRRIEDSRYEDV